MACANTGWEEGRNVVLEVRNAGPDPASFIELAAELDALKVDVIMAGNSEGSTRRAARPQRYPSSGYDAGTAP